MRGLWLNTWWLMAALMVLLGQESVRAAGDETKVALVIGNSRYISAPSVPVLDTPGNDAKELAEALTKIGFKVTLKIDLSKEDFEAALEDFERTASNADIALLYFAGHGVQYKGENYFLPVDIAPKDNVSIKHQSIPMSSVVDVTSEARKFKIIIVDACRNSVSDRVAAHSRAVLGIGDASGLAAINATDGMIVFYSTEHGKVAFDSGGSGRNSPFAQSLIKRVLEPGRNIKDVFTEVGNDVKITTAGKQHPEIVSDELTSGVFLNPAETPEAAWLRIHNSKVPEDFKKFMREFPDSPLAEDAQRILDYFSERKLDAERQAEERRKIIEQEAAKQKLAEVEKQLADLKDAEQGRLEKEREAAAKAEAEKQQQMAAAEQARIAKEKADKEAEAKRLAEQAAAAKKILADAEAAAREAAEKARRAAEEEAEAARKLEAAKQQAKAEEEAREKEAAAAAAKAIADACARDQAEIARLKDAGQSGPIQVLKSQSVCPAVPAAADQATKEIAANHAKLCSDDQKKLSRIDPKDGNALKAALDTLTCDAVRQSASTQIAKLEEESLRAEQQLEKERAEKEAAAKAEAEKQQQMVAEKKAAEEGAAEEKRKASEAAAAEQARVAKEKADKEAEAKRLGEQAAAAKKILADEADAARKIADRQAVEKAVRVAEEEAEAARKLEAAKQQAEAEEEARRKAAAEAAAREAAKKAVRAAEEEAEAARKFEAAKQQAKAEEEAREKEAAAAAAKAIADACARDQAEIVRLKDAGQSGPIQVLKSQSVCPAVPAAADQATNEIAANHAKLCADDQKKLSRIDPKDGNALRAALDTLTCDAVRQSASTQIAKLEEESLRAEQICADERAKFAAIDLAVRTAREDVSALQAKSQCVSLRPDLTAAMSDIDKRVASAQEELQRLGCYRVKPTSGRFDGPMVKALTDYLTARHASDVNTPRITAGLVDELASQDFQVCTVPLPTPTPKSPGVVSEPPPKRVLARPPDIYFKPKHEKSGEVGSPAPHKAVAEKARPAPASPAVPKPAASSAPLQIKGTGF
jgi:hypothetical protein